MSRILVTGGAGFIGSFMADELVKKGHFVRIFDNLEEQVHLGKIPDYLNKNAEFVNNGMTNYDALKDAIADIDIVIHLAAVVGVGQSMYAIQKYVNSNTLGTAVLLDILANEEHDVKKLLVASSMSTYGEGSYNCSKCGLIEPKLRDEGQMSKKEWEVKCPKCISVLKPIPTTEEKKQDINSIYALTKKDQEDMCLMVGKSYGIKAVALRYFNVYGPRQSLSNPYTGVAAIFLSRIKNNKQPVIFEDGLQTRDFISVHDIVSANLLAMESNSANYEIFNVGTGNQITIKSIAEALAKLCNKDIKPSITHNFRRGDVRHCFADITKIKNKLGFSPKISFEDGMRELVQWSETAASYDKVSIATEELKKKGLLL
ncbi:GDP-mannose 4,6-dehydratase [Candidatus Woesearchaeota archaeon]|nr:GDP-mannose 4,6-dehydratase [Candidatus Woesearchaeota archaeon]